MSTTTTLFGSAEAQAARALVGGTTLGYNRNDLLKQILVATANRTGGTSGAAWGAITGTLSAQTDLQTALDAKLNKAGGAFTGLTGAGFRDTSAVFDVTLGFTSSVVLDAARALTIDVGNVAHTIALGTTAGTITFPNAAAVTVAGLQIANVFTAAQTITAGTLTTAALTLTQTWNNAGVTCRGVEIAITNTNSAADSTMFRILGGAAGTSQLFNVDKNGWINGPTGATMVIAPVSGNNLALYTQGGGNVQFYSSLNLAEGGHFVCGTSNGNKFGTATTQKIAFWNATPVVQPTHIADPSGGAIIDAEARTAINSILAWQATLGLTAAA